MNIENLLIEDSATILDAMHQLEKNGKKIVFVTNKRHLKAALSDGDIRRWLLKGGDINATVSLAANFNPKYVFKKDVENIVAYMKQHALDVVPIVDDNLNVIDVYFWDTRKNTNIKEQIHIPVVIMAGGRGTRLYPYTKILPKALIPIDDVPIIERIINVFFEFGCREFYLVLNHKKNMIKTYFNELQKDYSVHYVEEDTPLGTGGGLSLLRGKIQSTFFLSNCDILIRDDIAKIYRHHKENTNLITMVCSLKNIQIPYGIVEISNNGTIKNMREKPRMSFYTNTGCYVVEPDIIRDLEYNQAIDFTEIIEHYRDSGKAVGVYPIGENSWLDMGQMDELIKMDHFFTVENHR